MCIGEERRGLRRAPSHPSTPPHRLNDSTRYFFERAADILSSTYLPTEQDSLRARVRTTGIVQQHFEIKERKYTMFDVGGQRNERRKWIHCFDNVTACIFVTAISEFDQKLYEVASPSVSQSVSWAELCSVLGVACVTFLPRTHFPTYYSARTRAPTAWTRL